MKILFVCNPSLTSNPYVHTLIEGLLRLDVDARMSCDDLWNKDDYDIIHFQWPEAIFKWADTVSFEQVERFKLRVCELKKAGKKIAFTVHNLKPHTIKDNGIEQLYNLVYEAADLIVHMGQYSYQLLSAKYPNARHVIIPHHIYDGIYNFSKDKFACQRQLQIDSSKVNILCFGEFRTDDEREFIIRLQKALELPNVAFLTPGFFRKHWYSKSIKETLARIRKKARYTRLGFRFRAGTLDNITTEQYFTACDIVLLQRLSILNSGNLPMGFHAGKVVVGVDSGNVGCILGETGNPSFIADNLDSAKKAILTAIELSCQGLGEKNRLLAEQRWSTISVASKLKEEYERLTCN